MRPGRGREGLSPLCPQVSGGSREAFLRAVPVPGQRFLGAAGVGPALGGTPVPSVRLGPPAAAGRQEGA